MPPLKGAKKNPLTGKFEVPKNNAPEPVREPIKTALGAGGTDEDFAASLPDSTVNESPTGEVIPPEKKVRKPREPKTIDSDDPMMKDPEYKRCIGKMNGLGGSKIIKVGFKATGKPLDNDEEGDVNDLFYVIGKRAKIDPGSNWWILGIYAFFLLCRLIVIRTEAGSALAGIFDKPSQSEELAKTVEEAE